jgi:hemerythrin-like domain-containing protein
MSVIEKVRVRLGTYSDTDVRALLHADHEVIRDLAKELAETQSAARRKTLVRELKEILVPHSRSEEAAVYTPLMRLRNSPDSRAAGSEGMVEHNLADIVLERLANTADVSSDMWKAHAVVLHEALEHHIKEEESKVFEELGEHFSDEQREAMGVEFTQGKLKLLKSKAARAASPRKRETANA